MNREWKECKLGDAVTLQRGHDLPKRKMCEGDIPVAGSNGIIGYHNESTTSAPGVTIGRSGNIGNPFYYKNDFWAHNTTLYVKDFKGNDELYIFYLLKIFDFKQYNVGSAVPTLNRNHIHPLPINLPPLPEQKRIAEILSSLDDKIELNNKMNKNLEEMAQAIFKQWFVDFEFPDENGKPYKSSGGKMIESELGEIPDGWSVKRIEDICKVGSSKRIFSKEYVNDGVPFYRGKEIIEKSNGKNISTELFISNEKYNEIKNKYGVPEIGDILLTSVGTLGASYLVSDEEFYFKDGNLTWFKDFIQKELNLVLFLLFNSKIGTRKFDEITIGSTQKALTITALNSIKLVVPIENKLINEFYKIADSIMNYPESRLEVSYQNRVS